MANFDYIHDDGRHICDGFPDEFTDGIIEVTGYPRPAVVTALSYALDGRGLDVVPQDKSIRFQIWLDVAVSLMDYFGKMPARRASRAAIAGEYLHEPGHVGVGE